MTDKVHPVVEAMARAVLAKRTGIPDCYDNTRSWAEESDDAMEQRCKARGYGRSVQQTQVENREYERRSLAALHDEMKAAANVLIEECANLLSETAAALAPQIMLAGLGGDEAGSEKVSAACAALNHAEEAIRSLADDMGLEPSARSEMGV